MNPKTMEISSLCDDFMEATLKLPETQMEEGYKDGYKDGLSRGKQDAYQLGLQHGFQCGEEVGFYRGLLHIWTAVICLQPDFFSNRVKKNVEQLDSLIRKYPFMNPEDENKDVVVDEMRLKFKVQSYADEIY